MYSPTPLPQDITRKKFRVISKNGGFYAGNINLHGLWYCIKRALDAEDVTTGNVGISLCGTEGGMAEKGLNVTDVGAAFKKVGGKSMAKAVNREFFVDFGTVDGVVEDVLGGTDCQWTGGRLAREKPGLYSIKCIVFIEKTGGLFGQKRATVFAAFTALNIDNFAGQIYMLLFEGDYLADP